MTPTAREPGRRHSIRRFIGALGRLTLGGWFVSHDLAVVRQLTDEPTVLRRGTVVGRGPTARVLDHPEHPYTQQLRASVPRPGWKPKRRGFIPPTGDEALPRREVD